MGVNVQWKPDVQLFCFCQKTIIKCYWYLLVYYYFVVRCQSFDFQFYTFPACTSDKQHSIFAYPSQVVVYSIYLVGRWLAWVLAHQTSYWEWKVTANRKIHLSWTVYHFFQALWYLLYLRKCFSTDSLGRGVMRYKNVCKGGYYPEAQRLPAFVWVSKLKT